MKTPQENGVSLLLCIDCAMKLQNMHAQTYRINAEMANYHADQINFALGMPPRGPRFPSQIAPIIQAGEIALHNINVSNSNVGVLNTGKIESIDNAIGYLSDTGGKPIADGLRAMTEAVIASNEANTAQKGELLELLGVLAGEASVPAEKRKSKAMLPIIGQISSLTSGLNALTQLWAKWAPAIKAFFGLG